MPHRDFDAERRERQRATDPITFTLGGHVFECLPWVEVNHALALADAPDPEDNESAAVRAILKFVGHMIAPTDRVRWARLIAGERTLMDRLLRRRAERPDPQAIVDLGAWLGEQYQSRPFGVSTASWDGPDGSGQNSNSAPSKSSGLSSVG